MENILKNLIHIAKKAGEEILNVYQLDFKVEYKDDNSPLTQADKNSHDIIVQGLKKISDYPILSEEGKEVSFEERKNWDYFWMIDPLDGTKEFINKNGEFTVNIALIYKNRPILGIVYAPALDILYYGEIGKGAYKVQNGKEEKLPISYRREKNKIRIVASKSHLNEETSKFIKNLEKYYDTVETTSIGSSLKICLVAEGKADIYPRLAPTMEWDTAAAHAILNAAGGKMVEYKKTENLIYLKQLPELKYNKENLLNPSFVALRADVF
ncbi:3'(2'),5'-bisphosphate nucleotidase CysQ [Persephonella sp. IF05-L8]|uniref:3'(2'),5'-bisphosphate nucleotidase CysQ n=1 Tax=Persephonella sp. IF05-L8 TaxID=1158338 RepID=UPI0004956C39